ncbi:MAG: choice-of-anchor J domain-containing protein [Verrucomicrobiales bacterium]
MVTLSSCALVQAQSVLLLESFEDSVDAVEVVGGNARTVDDITISQHTKMGADDIRVTDGEKSLKLELGASPAWNPDTIYTFSEENSTIIKEAWASKEEARYILRFDVIFPEGLNWGNNTPQLNGNWRYGQAEHGGQLSRTMSIPLDVIERTLSEEELITLRFIHNFGVDEFNGIEMYFDNIRLVDSYVSGAVPEVNLLNGFESEEDLSKIAPVTERFELSLHEKSGPADIAVTEGEGSLEIKFNERGAWKRDFTIPFNGTIMESIAALPPGARKRYTLRLDVIYEERGDNWTGNWQNFNIRPANGGTTVGNISMARFSDDQHVRTYSITMDQIELDPAEPGISIVNQGAWGDAGTTWHIDNVRVIDTGVSPLKIGDIALTAEGQASLSWASSDSQSYAVEASTDLIEWIPVTSGIVGEAGSTSFVDTNKALFSAQFYRVSVSGAAPPLREDFENGMGSWRSITKAGPGTTEWEIGEASNGPPAAKSGIAVAGTDLDADYAAGTHISLISPEVNLETFLKEPTLSFSYFLALGDAGAARINVLDLTETLIEEGSEDNGLFITENTDGWTDISVTLPASGQKVLLEFEFVAGGSAAGFFIDDVTVSESP